jgi:hypothetical protein
MPTGLKILGMVLKFCARPKIDLHIVSAPNFFLTNFYLVNSIFGPAQNTLGPVEGQGTSGIVKGSFTNYVYKWKGGR